MGEVRKCGGRCEKVSWVWRKGWEVWWGEVGDDVGEVRKDVGGREKVWEEVREMWRSIARNWKMWGRCEKVCWNVEEVWVVGGSMRRCVWGVGRGVGNVSGWKEVVRKVDRGGRCGKMLGEV